MLLYKVGVLNCDIADDCMIPNRPNHTYAFDKW